MKQSNNTTTTATRWPPTAQALDQFLVQAANLISKAKCNDVCQAARPGMPAQRRGCVCNFSLTTQLDHFIE